MPIPIILGAVGVGSVIAGIAGTISGKKKSNEAKKLLEQGDRKIKYIASQLGYEDSLYFSKVFKKVTGTSPKEFVRLSKEEKA